MGVFEEAAAAAGEPRYIKKTRALIKKTLNVTRASVHVAGNQPPPPPPAMVETMEMKMSE